MTDSSYNQIPITYFANKCKEKGTGAVFKYFKKVIEWRDTDAFFALYFEGLNDFRKAEKYYLKAMDADVLDAYQNYGILLKTINRTEEFESIARFFKKAASQRHFIIHF